MSSFILAAKVVMPLLVYMAGGGLIRKLKIMNRENFRALNAAVFRFFLPLTLFFNIYEVELSAAVRPRVFGLMMAAILAVFAVTWILTDRLVKSKPDGSSVIQGIYRSNFVLFGSWIAASLCGEEGQALTAALAAVVVPLFNVLAVILFETRRGGEIRPAAVIINIFKNPLVDAGLLGCVWNLADLRLPQVLEIPLTAMAEMATPLALVTLGGLLSFGSMKSHWKYLMAVTVSRLCVVPLAALLFFILLGYRGDVLAAALAVFASPTAVASGPMAQSMGGNGSLSGEIVAVTSVCCVFTIFLFVSVLSGTGMI